MTKIYVVFGTTGEYSDRSEWSVCAYRAEEAAQDMVEKASAAARTIFANRESRYSLTEKETNPYDPRMIMDYTGTSYYYVTVDFQD